MDGEPGTGTMVSRSLDGDLLIPTLRVRRIIPIRGSSLGNGQDKGGRSALKSLIEHVRSGAPGLLAVDGPRGPRNRVSKGIALLSQKTGAVILNVVMVPNRRWILSRTWDRLQIPKPFATTDAYFAEPVIPREGESMERYRQRIELSLNELEAKHDWEEAQICRAVSPERKKRAA